MSERPGATAFGAFQKSLFSGPGNASFLKGRYFGIVDSPQEDCAVLKRFTAAIEKATVISSHTSMNVSQKGALLKHVGLVKGLAKELDINESCLEKLADEVRKDLGSK
jgi:hypothetical protein